MKNHGDREKPSKARVGYSLGHIRGASSMSFKDMLARASQIALIGTFLLACIFALETGGRFLIPVTAAILIGFTFGPAIDWLEGRGVNSYVASICIILGLSAAAVTMFYALAAPLEEWARRAPLMWDKFVDELRSLRGTIASLNQVSESLQDVSNPDAKTLRVVAISDGGLVPQLLIVAPVLAGQIVVFLCTLYFFLANRTRVRETLLSFCMSSRARLRTARIFRDVEYFLSRYVSAIALINIGLGFVTAITMALLDMPAPFLWGMLAALMNFVPYVGPAVVAVVLGGVGLVTFDGEIPAMVPALVFVGLNVVESQFVTPGLIGRTLTINPLAVFLALVFWMWLWGPVGGLIAVPALIVAVVVLMHLLPHHDAIGMSRFARPASKSKQSAAPQGASSSVSGGEVPQLGTH